MLTGGRGSNGTSAAWTAVAAPQKIPAARSGVNRTRRVTRYAFASAPS